jgi:hypothetical protein
VIRSSIELGEGHFNVLCNLRTISRCPWKCRLRATLAPDVALCSVGLCASIFGRQSARTNPSIFKPA